MVADEEGFLRPQADVSKCVDCGLCEKVCPSLNQGVPRLPLAVYAAQAKDGRLRSRSSSGGVFTLLARRILAKGGIVYGAVFDVASREVRHVSAENEEELAALRGSKYVQSDLRNVMREVREQLKTGRAVLFSGTPCQVAGLKRFLGRDYANLLTVDMVCHAVPSPLAWRKYLERRIADLGKGDVPLTGVSFRDKKLGWYQFSVRLDFADGTRSRGDILSDMFLRGFLLELFNRPSCHDCACRELKSGADLTIADYWMVHQKFPDIDDDRGTSLVMVDCERGAAAWSEISDELSAWESTYEDAVRTNPAIVRSFKPWEGRSRFFCEVDRMGFDEAVRELQPKVEFPPDRLVLMGRGKTDDED